MTTGDVTLSTSDGPMRAYEATPDSGASTAVIVIPEAFGLNGHIEDVTERFATAGHRAVGLDIFHRSGGGTAPYDDFEKVLPLFEGLPTTVCSPTSTPLATTCTPRVTSTAPSASSGSASVAAS